MPLCFYIVPFPPLLVSQVMCYGTAGDADGESAAAACLVHALVAPAGPDLLPHLACGGTGCTSSLARRLADGGCHAGVAAAAAGGLEALARLPANRPIILQVCQAARGLNTRRVWVCRADRRVERPAVFA